MANKDKANPTGAADKQHELKVDGDWADVTEHVADDGETRRHVEAGTKGAGYDVVVPGGDGPQETVTLTGTDEEKVAQLKAAIADIEKPRAPRQPSFGISEGIRDQLEREGKAVDPFTGKTLTRDDLK
jgi:hypothetical protein